MKVDNFFLKNDSLRNLSSLIGQKWRCFGGTSMDADRYQPFEVFLVADHTKIIIESSAEYFDITDEKYQTAVAGLSVLTGTALADTDQESGHVFMHFSEQKVTDVLVVRHSIDAFRDGNHPWQVVKDVGIIVALENGVIAVSQDDIHDEMLVVTLSKSVKDLALPPVRYHWQNKPEIDYTTD